MTPNGQHIPPDTLQPAPDTPSWAAGLFDMLHRLLEENQRFREDLDALREAMGANIVTRTQAAAILGKSEKTIRRLEARKKLKPLDLDAPGVYFALTAVVKLKHQSPNHR